MHPLKTVLAAVAFLASNTDALSTGVGGCGPGDTSINNAESTNIHQFGARGTMADLGVTFSIGGTALTASTATSFGVGSDLQWSIDSTNAFKGAFIRVEKASGTFTHVAGSALLGEALSCAGITGVQGLDHTDAAAKTSVTGTSTFDAAGSATVDIVVVFSTASYAYSQFLLTLDQVAVPTETPIAAPVAVPTETPVAAPVAVPTETPVAAPVVAPTETPIAAPVPAKVPTSAPVTAPIVPVSVPTKAPAVAPVTEPVAPPTKEPLVTVEPTTTPPPTKEPLVTVEPTIASPIIAPTKPPKKMGMETKAKNGKNGNMGKMGKMGKKDMKGMMKRHNLRY